MKKGFEVTPQVQPERAFLVGVSLPDSSVAREYEYLEELEQLALTAGAEVVGRTVQSRTRIDGTSYIGPGKAASVKDACTRLGANLVIFDEDLSPAQARNLEKLLGVNVIDRTELILDIFARHAKTQQAKIQVELAQLIYALPRLTRLWDHLSRQAGGIGLRGPGETQLEVDRRRIHQRMGALRRQLKKISQRKDTIRKNRSRFPVVALVGYTNAGKSTLMRALTGARTPIRDQLFATLDTMTRRIDRGANGRNGHNGGSRDPILVIDTVGFIRKLPDHLMTSFRATLEDIARADLFLHVVDVSHPSFEEHMDVTDTTLESLNDYGVETIHVLNKIDRLGTEISAGLQRQYSGASFISAATGDGVDDVVRRIEDHLRGRDVKVEVKIHAADGKGISTVRELLHNVRGEFHDDICVLEGTIDTDEMGRLEKIVGAEVRFIL